MTDLALPPPKLFLPDLLMTVFLRLVSLGCLWYGLQLWGDLIGYSHGGKLRFDLIDVDMKAAYTTLSVLYPVAALGLWLRGAWGPVLWTAAAAMEIATHEFMPATFGDDHVKVVAIAAAVVVYLVLRLTIFFLKPARNAAALG